MRVTDIIGKTRDGVELTREEIDFFISGYCEGDIPDYQASAWAMAVLLNGMTAQETTYLTMAMAESGEILDLSSVVPMAVDKHSTGGVGDKTTIVVEPLVAACGLPIGKMSGRGLGFTGGTLDKMESIPGFRTDLTTEEFLNQLGEVGMVLTGQTASLAPADGKLYSLRDVTGTVQSIPLIASSIMSKKIASGAHGIVLDVKVGEGAFMNTLDDACELSEMMVSIAELAGRKAVALLSDMNQPLGVAVGNALELKEAIKTLHGEGPKDFLEHCLVVAGYLLLLGGVYSDFETAREQALEALRNGSGWDKFRLLVQTQGGDLSYVDDIDKLPRSELCEHGYAERDGWVREINARVVGETACWLGAGRSKKGDPIDYSVGVEIYHNIGDKVKKGDRLFSVHANRSILLSEGIDQLHSAYEFSDELVEPLPLFYDVIE